MTEHFASPHMDGYSVLIAVEYVNGSTFTHEVACPSPDDKDVVGWQTAMAFKADYRGDTDGCFSNLYLVSALISQCRLDM